MIDFAMNDAQTRNFQALSAICSPEEGHYAFNSVLLKGNGSHVDAVATDGRVLAMRRMSTESYLQEDSEGLYDGQQLRKAKILKSAEASAEANSTLCIVQRSKAGERINKIDANDHGVFPSYERLLPDRTPDISIRLGVDCLRMLLDAAGESTTLDFGVTDSNSPIIVRNSDDPDNEFIGVIAPVFQHNE